MSPEQARGQAVDRRTDLWAFGCVLYEMLVGGKAFDGPTVTDVLAAVVTKEPDWNALPAGTPASVRRLLRRCLEKDLKKRLRDAGDASLLLDDNPDDRSLRRLRASIGRSSTRMAPCSPLGAGGGPCRRTAGRSFRSTLGPGGVLPDRAGRQRFPPTRGSTSKRIRGSTRSSRSPSDGARIAFVAGSRIERRLYIRALDRLEPTLVPRSEGASSPFFSPDGRWIGFFARGKLKKATVDGGEPIELADSGVPRGGVWCDDDTIVYSPLTTSGLLRIPSGGGTPTPLTTLDASRQERTHRFPAPLPNGEVAFTVGTSDKSGSYDDSRIDAVELASGKRRTLVVGASMVRYAASGHLLLGRNGQIFAVPLADARGGPVANSRLAVQGVEGIETSGVVFFDVADDGTLIYAERDPQAKQLELVRVGRDGTVEPLPFPPREYRAPRVSPDGKRITVGVGAGRGGASDIWIGDLATGEMSRLTFGDGRGRELVSDLDQGRA